MDLTYPKTLPKILEILFIGYLRKNIHKLTTNKWQLQQLAKNKIAYKNLDVAFYTNYMLQEYNKPKILWFKDLSY